MKIPSLPVINSLLRPGHPTKTDWFRAVRPHFVTRRNALATAHTKTIPGRYNEGTLAKPAFPVLYLAENHVVALFEVQALVGSPVVVSGIYAHPGTKTWTVLRVDVKLQKVGDLTELNQQAIFDTNAQELTGDWRAYGYRNPRKTSVRLPSGFPAPTQELGTALRNVPDLEGFETVSATVPHMRTLVVFPDKLHPQSRVTLTDEESGEEWELDRGSDEATADGQHSLSL
jgi:RES domain-containing protein